MQSDHWARGRAAGERRRSAAVIGAAGFLGRHLTAGLSAAGVAVASYTRGTPFLSPDGSLAPAAARAGSVFWAATSITPAVAEADPALVRADLAAFSSLLAALQRLEAPPRVVLLGSGGTAYDDRIAPPYDETAPTRPRGAYGTAKLELERRLSGSGVPGVVARLSNVYGPARGARAAGGVVQAWLRSARDGRPLRLTGDAATTRDYVYVDDVVEALCAIHRGDRPLPFALNVGSGLPTTLADLVDLVREVIGDPGYPVRREPGRPFDVPRTWLDATLARRVLDWRPTTPLRAGVARTWHAVRREPLSGRVGCGRP